MTPKTFWDEFSKHASLWVSQLRTGKQRQVFDEIESLLDQHKLPFCFDITPSSSDCFLILSPEGDKSVATMIDALVAAAPAIPGWTIFSRRQKKDLSDVRAIIKQLYLFDPLSARFYVHDDNEVRHVEMHVPHSTDLTPEEAQGLVNTFLWHAIGEDVVMKENIVGALHFVEAAQKESLSAEELIQQLSS